MVVVAAGSGGAHRVLVISGKRAAVAPGGLGTRPVSVVLPSSSGSRTSSDSESNGSGPPLRKRQRLTHLSPEEKALRRKLKNRVAAQTARDRKKAKMGELEQQVLEMELENQKLHIENQMLREKTDGLLTENEELRQRLGLAALDAKEKVQVLPAHVEDVDLVTGSSESAAQATCASAEGTGPDVSKTEELHVDDCCPTPAGSEPDLLLGILDIFNPELFKCDDPSPEDLQQFAEEMADSLSPPSTPSVGASPVKLEALNELIYFDHVYTKSVEVCTEPCEAVSAVKLEELAFTAAPEDELLVETVSVKDEPEELAVLPEARVDCFSASPLHSTPDAACLMDAYSDSGYEQSPSPFSDVSSPLCSDVSWDDLFANELFPQLISV
ncbi:LOW QUALITY PROTEIN: X-box-binding protein 1 [Brienomyrus brachyistius]|uniref:LOW QUALITY PROTEIN: X-box-binding protein 1 n=1 Tax=Brienomyrus brachyistius TaxID=42636 RepID=UPI0020B2661F|nr:LOW QUALITY PROTEIN: X-box-binding protein 1 [Brienomyrus brachyistius]